MGAFALAVGLGVQLGESTIQEINPVHFQGPPIHPRDRGAAVDPNALPAARPGYAQAFGWGDGNAALRVDSGFRPLDLAPPPVARPAAESTWYEEPAPLELPRWAPGQTSAHRDVERYTDYPIEEKPADEAEPAAEWSFEEDVEDDE